VQYNHGFQTDEHSILRVVLFTIRIDIITLSFTKYIICAVLKNPNDRFKMCTHTNDANVAKTILQLPHIQYISYASIHHPKNEKIYLVT